MSPEEGRSFIQTLVLPGLYRFMASSCRRLLKSSTMKAASSGSSASACGPASFAAPFPSPGSASSTAGPLTTVRKFQNGGASCSISTTVMRMLQCSTNKEHNTRRFRKNERRLERATVVGYRRVYIALRTIKQDSFGTHMIQHFTWMMPVIPRSHRGMRKKLIALTPMYAKSARVGWYQW